MSLVTKFPPNKQTLCIAAGGPSINNTIRDRFGTLVTVNGAHDWLIDRGIVPIACGFMDWRPRLADMFTPREDVQYYVADSVHKAVEDKLEGFRVVPWKRIQAGNVCTMGLAWISIGHLMGYRKFDLHGFDSSFREGATHVYPNYQDDKERGKCKIGKFFTADRWVAQIIDFFKLKDRFKDAEFTIHGDGLLQQRVKDDNRDFPQRLINEINSRRRVN